jgi:hypothetical protein
MSLGLRRRSRAVTAPLVAFVAIATVLAGCATGARPIMAPGTVDAGSGFPLGSYAKEFTDPDVGRVRLVWTFEPDGQALDTVPIRGTWTADPESVSIASSYPPGMGTSRHGWRLDRDELWTYFLSSDNPDDFDWFTNLDVRPWTPFDT